MRLLLLVLLCALVSGGDRVVEENAGLLDEKILFHWIDAGLEPLRQGRTAILEGRAKRLDPAAARRRIEQADVVLVADLHQIDLIRRAFARLVKGYSKDREVAIALEALPPQFEEHYAQAKDKVDFLRNCWPWPVEAYAEVVKLGNPVLAVGEWRGVTLPGAEVADTKRRPGISISFEPTTTMDFKYGISWYRRNELSASRIVTWIRAGKRRKVFVLYGAAHYLEPGNVVTVGKKKFVSGGGMRSMLVERGMKVVVVVPLLPDWEVAFRKKKGGKGWYEVLPGVLRAPFP